MKTSPPKLPLQFLRWFCREDYLEEIEGDLIEVFGREVEGSPRKARWKFSWNVIKYFRPGFIKKMGVFEPRNNYGMYRNYLKVSFRVFNRERMYSLINVFGLALGFACCLLIFLFIKDELSYDKFHKDSDQIYRVASAYMRQGKWEPYGSNSWRTADLIKANFGEIQQLIRIRDDSEVFVYEEKQIIERKIAYVEENFLEVFNFPLLEGNPTQALKGPNKVVISESAAARYFGNNPAIGKVFDAGDGAFQLEVSAVMKDMPANSHFHFDFLISGETQRQVSPESLFTNVGWDSQYVYIKVEPGTDPAAIDARFPDFINDNLDPFNSSNFKLFLQPLTSIHLESDTGLELEPNGSLKNVYTFSVIAIFILAIACVNYMNLTTARSLRRAKEVGMRKVLGAKRFDLINQFLTESFMMTFLAILLAGGISVSVLELFNQFAGKAFSADLLFQPEILLVIFLAFVIIAMVSGSYPSLVLSAFRPLNSMKGAGKTGKSGFVFRKGLVVLQFIISMGLIAASMIVFKQWQYLKTKELGINQEMMVTIPLQTMERSQLDVFKNELFKKASIKGAGTSNMKLPGWIFNSTPYKAQDEVVDAEAGKSMKIIRVDMDFLSTIEAEFMDGRNFSGEFPADSSASVILNESAVAQLEWKDPIGKWIELGNGQQYTVVGVVKDFHFESLHREIPPTIFIFSPDFLNYAYVRIDGQDVQSSIAHIGEVYSAFVTNRDFSYSFMNEDIAQQYEAEEKFAYIFSIFTVLAIVIACLGTFGLISFSAEQKQKEIGIRKVLGASARQVTYLLIREFLTLLLVASLVMWPLTWYLANNWMGSFVYRTQVGIQPFLIATVLAMFIVLLTIGFRALKAALANPVESLRSE
jgi:putative ABC transport system permease protein